MSFRRTAAIVSLAVLASCGGSSKSSEPNDSTGPDASVVDPVMDANEPTVSLPATTPTELVVTDLTPGEGPAAVEGDTVFVYYVGVLTKDGTRFDGNYGGSPFAVTLGTGSVIKGWEQGLVGIQAGGRRQLDIPADLAYGDTGAGGVIKPGDAISFVVDAVAIVPATSPDNEPQINVTGGPNVDVVGSTDLVDGTGTTVKSDMSVVVQLVAYRADTGEKLTTTWTDPAPVTFKVTPGGTLPGLLDVLTGMKVGGRRQAQIPFELAWGSKGQQQIGLPENTDLVVVIDLLAAF